MHNGFVVKVEKLRPHSNADRLQIATFFGSDTCVGLDVKVGDIGLYFPCDLQLSEEFCDHNHLCRTKADGTKDTGYLERDKRNVKAIRLRGEKSDGIYVPISALNYCFENNVIANLSVGDVVKVVNGHSICDKYIPRGNHAHGSPNHVSRTRRKGMSLAPTFAEHVDTEQLAYNLGAFKPGDEIEITLKMHGTSHRTGYLPVFKGFKRTIWDRLFGRKGKAIYEYDYVSGTRRTVLNGYDGGYYGSNAFREQYHKLFEGKLQKGETVYAEIVGFIDNGTPIMADGKNKSLGKEFVEKYGEKTVFSYGCEPGKSDIYVYRMTVTNEEGFAVEYSPDFMRYRCEQMGVKCVPVFTKCILHDYDLENDERTAGEVVKDIAELFYDGSDPVGKTHVREGVVVRILNRPSFTAFKHKNHDFKVLSGIIAEQVADSNTEMSDDILAEL